MVLLLAGGTAGYVIIEEWPVLESIYMTVITITTIGFGEIRPLSETGRAFTIVLIVAGVAVAAALISRVGQLVVEAGLTRSYGRRRMSNRVRRLRDHYLICGYGRIGSAIAVQLFEDGIEFVVVEGDEEKIQHAQARGFAVVLGDAARDATLLTAGVERARGSVLCVRDDATNVNIALAARELNPRQRIIARGSDPSLEYRLNRAGADTVVYPMQLGGEQIARLLVDRKDSPADEQAGSMRVLGYELRVFTNTEADRTVRELLSEKRAIRPVAIRREDGTMDHNPKPDVIVAGGDSLLVLVNEEQRADRTDAIGPRDADSRHSVSGSDPNREVEGHQSTPTAPLLEWNDSLAVNVREIDDEHRTLFKYVRDFQQAVQSGTGGAQLNRIFTLLLQYTETHFSHEEELMRASDYPFLDAHHAQHGKLTRQVMQLRRDREFILPENLSEFLSSWLVLHIESEDRTFAEYLRARAV